METMQLITTNTGTDAVAWTSPGLSADLTTLDDPTIEAIFSEAGLSVDVVDHCADVSCPECFGRRSARAA